MEWRSPTPEDKATRRAPSGALDDPGCVTTGLGDKRTVWFRLWVWSATVSGVTEWQYAITDRYCGVTAGEGGFSSARGAQRCALHRISSSLTKMLLDVTKARV